MSLKELLTDEFIIDLFSKGFNYFNSKLAKIQEEWEDYEEPKNYWFIDCDGAVLIDDLAPATTKKCMELGNYFETQEEAEKAVEKLKKLQILRNKGYKIDDYIDIIIKAGEEWKLHCATDVKGTTVKKEYWLNWTIGKMKERYIYAITVITRLLEK